MIQSPEKLRPTHWAAILLMGLLFCIPSAHFILYGLDQPAPDFQVYWRTAKLLLAGDIGGIYRIEGPMVFRYSPFTLFLFAPLGLLPLPQARAVWIVFQLLACWVALFTMGWTTAHVFKLSRRRAVTSTIVVAALIYRYYLANLHSGQVTPFSIAIGSLGLMMWFQGRIKTAVTLVVARSMFKIVPGLWLLPVVWICRGASFRLISFGAAASVMVGSALSFPFIQFERFLSLPQEWVELVFAHHDQYRSPTSYSQSLPSAVLRAIHSGALPVDSYWLLTAGASGAILLATLIAWRRIDLRSPQAQFGIFASVSLLVRLIAPDNFPYANLPLLFPLFYFVARAWESVAYRWLLVFFFVTLTYPGRDTLYPAWFEIYREWSLPFVARSLIFFAFLALLRQDATRVPRPGARTHANWRFWRRASGGA